LREKIRKEEENVAFLKLIKVFGICSLRSKISKFSHSFFHHSGVDLVLVLKGHSYSVLDLCLENESDFQG